MNVSVKGEYALQAIFDLAVQDSQDPVKIADIARRQAIPQKFLELILANLKQGGFVQSKRGAEGGYLLARAADQISVGEVLRYVEGTKATKSERTKSGPLASFWDRVEGAMAQVIDKTTFAELARDWKERQSKYVPNWDI
ncbi:AsnC family transcriptional regulator [Bryobacterales bacterium F-183]|nr:AsnC family transcriptional regulator [Bryobacterales bacterium F-183]